MFVSVYIKLQENTKRSGLLCNFYNEYKTFQRFVIGNIGQVCQRKVELASRSLEKHQSWENRKSLKSAVYQPKSEFLEKCIEEHPLYSVGIRLIPRAVSQNSTPKASSTGIVTSSWLGLGNVTKSPLKPQVHQFQCPERLVCRNQ